MTHAPGSVVVIPRLLHGRAVVGTVRYQQGPYTLVELTDGQVIPCLGDVLKAASNIVPLRRRNQEKMIEW